jgi:hypothetical protein
MLIWVSVKCTEGVAATALETSQSHTLSARAASIRSCRPASLVRSWRLDRLHKHGTFWYRLLGSIFFFFFMYHRLLLLPGSRITRTASLLKNRLRIALGAQSHGGWTPEKATEVLTHHRPLGRTLRARLLLRSLQIHIRSLPIYLSIYLSPSLPAGLSVSLSIAQAYFLLWLFRKHGSERAIRQPELAQSKHKATAAAAERTKEFQALMKKQPN